MEVMEEAFICSTYSRRLFSSLILSLHVSFVNETIYFLKKDSFRDIRDIVFFFLFKYNWNKKNNCNTLLR